MEHHVEDTLWDYLIIGTGVGGSTIGHSLAASGKKILYLEKGRALAHHEAARSAIQGGFPDERLSHFSKLSAQDRDLLKNTGRYTDFITDISLPKHPINFLPLLGQGAGGSSLLYGAAMERFYPQDFRATQFFGPLKDSSTVDWPIGYQDLEPFYTQAEQLFGVVGGQDPLRPEFQNPELDTPSLSSVGKQLFAIWQRKGLHPYRLPVGHKPHEKSTCPGCQAMVCPSHDKSDAASRCLYPSLKFENVHLLDESEVTQIQSDAERVTGVLVKRRDRILRLRAQTVILAAGAIDSPKILFKSKNRHFPQGLANRSGQVGKNLSRHFMDLYMIRMDPYENNAYIEKECALNDFYMHSGDKLGTVQSLGIPPSVSTTLFEMYHQHFKSPKLLDKLFYLMASTVGKPIIRSVFKRNLCIATIMDDVSYEDNCVSLGEDGETMNLQYRIRPEGQQRLKKFRSLILKSFAPMKVELHKQGENNQRLGHASGTCRMGDDPRNSVVDRYNRAHDLENLYIVDASFFPSGSGINPSLTIAANAIRVGRHLLQREPLKTRERQAEVTV